MLTALLLAMCVERPSVVLEASVDGGPARREWVYARRGQAITLRAVAPGVQAADVEWFKVEPTAGSLDNTTPTFHFAPVPYQETPLPACRGRLECPADVAPSVLQGVDGLAGVGTMAFKVRLTLADGTVRETAGAGCTKYGGLTREVFRVTVRRDDSLLGYATELLNTPYIFGSAGPDGRNQSDLLIGSDCADLIIYARRRMGRRATYTSSFELHRQAPPLRAGQPARAGDLVHFPGARHVALLYEDVEPLGVVDENDRILHTCWAPPTVQRIGDTGCASPPYRVLRFASP